MWWCRHGVPYHSGQLCTFDRCSLKHSDLRSFINSKLKTADQDGSNPSSSALTILLSKTAGKNTRWCSLQVLHIPLPSFSLRKKKTGVSLRSFRGVLLLSPEEQKSPVLMAPQNCLERESSAQGGRNSCRSTWVLERHFLLEELSWGHFSSLTGYKCGKQRASTECRA